jgi:hypothetical protein
MLLNYKNKEFFKAIYGREPKNWSITDLNDLYLKLKTRSDSRWNDFRNFIYDVIFKELEEYEGKIHVYYYQNDDLRGFEIHKRKDYGFSYTFDDPTFKTREERLKFLLNSDPKNLELGQEFYRLKKLDSLASSSMWKVKSILADEIHKHLRDVKDKSIFKDKSFITINISGIKYVVKIENTHYDNYFRFTWDGETVNQNEIII